MRQEGTVRDETRPSSWTFDGRRTASHRASLAELSSCAIAMEASQPIDSRHR